MNHLSFTDCQIGFSWAESVPGTQEVIVSQKSGLLKTSRQSLVALKIMTLLNVLMLINFKLLFAEY